MIKNKFPTAPSPTSAIDVWHTKAEFATHTTSEAQTTTSQDADTEVSRQLPSSTSYRIFTIPVGSSAGLDLPKKKVYSAQNITKTIENLEFLAKYLPTARREELTPLLVDLFSQYDHYDFANFEQFLVTAPKASRVNILLHLYCVHHAGIPINWSGLVYNSRLFPPSVFSKNMDFTQLNKVLNAFNPVRFPLEEYKTTSDHRIRAHSDYLLSLLCQKLSTLSATSADLLVTVVKWLDGSTSKNMLWILANIAEELEAGHSPNAQALVSLLRSARAHFTPNQPQCDADVIKAIVRSQAATINLEDDNPDQDNALYQRFITNLTDSEASSIWNGLDLAQFTNHGTDSIRSLERKYPRACTEVRQGLFDPSDATHRHVAFFLVLEQTKLNTTLTHFDPIVWNKKRWDNICTQKLSYIYALFTAPHYIYWHSSLRRFSNEKSLRASFDYILKFETQFEMPVSNIKYFKMPSRVWHVEASQALINHFHIPMDLIDQLNLTAMESRQLCHWLITRNPSSAVQLLQTYDKQDLDYAPSLRNSFLAAIAQGAEATALSRTILALKIKNEELHTALNMMATASFPQDMQQSFLWAGYLLDLHKNHGASAKSDALGLKQMPAKMLFDQLIRCTMQSDQSALVWARIADAWPVAHETQQAVTSLWAISNLAHALCPSALNAWLTNDSGLGIKILKDLTSMRVHADRGVMASTILTFCADADGRALLDARPHLRQEKTAEARLIDVLLVIMEAEGLDVHGIRLSINASNTSPMRFAPRQRELLGFLLQLKYDLSLSQSVKQHILDDLGATQSDKGLYNRVVDASLLRSLHLLEQFEQADSCLTTAAQKAIKDLLGDLDVENTSQAFHQTFGSSRAKQAVWTYMSRIKSLNNKRAEETYLEFLKQVLTGTFEAQRAMVQGNPHLEQLERLQPGFMAAFVRSEAPVAAHGTAKSARLGEYAWLQQKIVAFAHLEGDATELEPLKAYLDGSKQVSEREQAAAAIKTRAAEVLEPETTVEAEQLLRLAAAQCVSLVEAQPDERVGTLRRLQALLLRMAPLPELYEDVTNRIHAATSPQAALVKGVLVDSVDPYDLLLCGTEVTGSCQRVNGTPHLNCGLLGTLLNGQTRLLTVKHPTTGKIIARRLLRALISEGKPALFLEPMYGDYRYGNEIKELALAKAQKLGVKLFDHGNLTPTRNELTSLGGRAPFEYSDGYRGNGRESAFTIKNAHLVVETI